MAAGEQRDQRLIDDLALTEDDATDTIANQRKASAERLDVGEELIAVVGQGRQSFAVRSHEIASFRNKT